MHKIDVEEWKEFPIGSLFRIEKGTRLTKANMEPGSIRFIGASSINNGITAYISNNENIHPKNTITLSYNGSVGEAFYQDEPFWASDDVNVLYPLFEMNVYKAMFIIPLLKVAGKKYAFIDKWTKENMETDKIKLPVTPEGLPDYQYMETYMRNLENVANSSLNTLRLTQTAAKKKIDVSRWEEFCVGDLFDKLDLKFLPDRPFNKAFDVSSTRTKEFNLPLVNAKHDNNGIMYYGRMKEWECAEMVLDIVQNGAISTGDVYAQPQPTGVLWDAYLIKPKFQVVTENVLLYLATTIQASIKKHFSYDDKCVWDKVKNEMVRLPAKLNQSGASEPDWHYMEQYIEHIKIKSNNALLLRHAVS